MRWFKKKKNKTEVKEYKFSTTEIVAIGDYYEYKVKAKNKKEAFNKLVEYFFGSKSSLDIESSSGTITQPQKDVFRYSGMPYWFAKRLTSEWNETHQKALEEYCIKNNINLKN